MSILGQEFYPGICVCIQAPSDNDFPIFARVMCVLVSEDLKFLLVQTFNTEFFSQHHNAYCVTLASQYLIIRVSELALHDVFVTYSLLSASYIVVRSCCHAEIFV